MQIEYNEAWDCDPLFTPAESDADEYAGLDEEDDKGDWQVIALDRWGDRRVTGSLTDHGADASIARSW